MIYFDISSPAYKTDRNLDCAQVDCAFVVLPESQYGISLQYDAERQRAGLNWRKGREVTREVKSGKSRFAKRSLS